MAMRLANVSTTGVSAEVQRRAVVGSPVATSAPSAVHMPDAAHLERLAAVLGVHWTDFYCVGHPETGGSERERTL